MSSIKSLTINEHKLEILQSYPILLHTSRGSVILLSRAKIGIHVSIVTVPQVTQNYKM